MTSVDMDHRTGAAEVEPVDMKFEVVVLSVSDVDRAKAFYQQLGWRLDADFVVSDDFRVVQVTPHHSEASILFGKGLTSARPGSAEGLVLVVEDVAAARRELIARGAEVSELFHYAGGPFNETGENPRVAGPDPERRSYYSFASFADPDGNSWLLQEIQTRFPGREWAPQTPAANVAALAALLREASEHHGKFEKKLPPHDWWNWYAHYLSACQNGSSPEEAEAAANRYVEG